ncbi:hypothetical protein CIHG_00809 [Coccidioides immitis H538.4]|uniref:Uncharacterized protein n=1 Tax=Coccidioides immitis H538.4 TaxID=396776 RepID=A0A0J8RDL8_COCIT|nr:hypothetical protein CIHG_00809 [Coccidioides immitis H538.4]
MVARGAVSKLKSEKTGLTIDSCSVSSVFFRSIVMLISRSLYAIHGDGSSVRRLLSLKEKGDGRKGGTAELFCLRCTGKGSEQSCEVPVNHPQAGNRCPELMISGRACGLESSAG